jgi:hypothetical protein
MMTNAKRYTSGRIALANGGHAAGFFMGAVNQPQLAIGSKQL